MLLAFAVTDRACGGFDLALEFCQAGLEILVCFPHRQKVSGFRIEQEEQAIQERQDSFENSVEPLLRKLGIASLFVANIRDKAIRQDLENLLEDAILQILAQARGKLAAAFEQPIQHGKLLATASGGQRCERLPPKEQPEIAERIAGFGGKRYALAERIGEIDLIVVTGARRCVGRVEPPQVGRWSS